MSLYDDTKIFGMLPLGKSLHAVLGLLFVFLFITQTCIEKDNSTIIFQLCTAALSFNLALDAAEQGLWASATVYHWIHDVSVFFIFTNGLAAIGFTESRSLFNVFKEKKRMQKSPKTDIALNCLFVAASFITSAAFDSPTCQLFFCLYLGYLLFRVHNYLHSAVLSDMLKAFPLLNVNSSAFTVLVILASLESSTVHVFLTTSLMPEEIKVNDKTSRYLLTFFTVSVAQFLHINFTFSTNMFAEQIASYQIALTRHYPRGLHTNGEIFLVWTVFSAVALLMMGIGLSLMVNLELMFGGLYVLLEISCEWY